MNYIKRFFLTVTAAVLLSAVPLFAGGSGDATTEEEGKVVLSYWSTDSKEPRRSIAQSQIDRFNAANPDIQIVPEFYDDEALKTKIKVAVAGNMMPDVFPYWSGESFKTMVDADVVADLTDSLTQDSEYKNRFIGGAFDQSTYDGRIYGIPSGFGSVVIWYNKELFAQAGIEKTPETWIELLSDVDALNAAGIIPITVAGKDRWPVLHWFSYLAQRIGGEEPFAAVTAGTGDFTEASFVKAGELLRDLVERKGFINGFLGLDYGSAEAQFTSGRAAIYMQGDWSLGAFTQDPTLSDKIGFFPFPAVAGGRGDALVFHGGFGGGLAVSKNADIEAAYTFVRYILGPEQLKEIVEKRGSPAPMPVDADPSKMNKLVYEYVTFVGSKPKGFFGYYDQQLEPKRGELILNAVQKIVAVSDADIAETLATVQK